VFSAIPGAAAAVGRLPAGGGAEPLLAAATRVGEQAVGGGDDELAAGLAVAAVAGVGLVGRR
jgi:hypothetical protein